MECTYKAVGMGMEIEARLPEEVMLLFSPTDF